MRSIAGRLSDIGLKELFRLLSAAGVAGDLEVSSAVGIARLAVGPNGVLGEPSPVLLHAFVTRAGTFCFRPVEVVPEGAWRSVDEMVAVFDLLADRMTVSNEAADLAGPWPPEQSTDPLAALTTSLAGEAPPGGGPRVLVLARTGALLSA